MEPIDKQSAAAQQPRPIEDDIARLQVRVAQAWASADRAKQAGSQEQQMESFCLAEALELQLGRLLNARRAAGE